MANNFKQDVSSIRSYVLLIVLLVVSLICVTGYAREGDGGILHSMQSSVSGIFMPLKMMSGGISAAEDAAGTAASDATADANTLSALKAQNEELRSTIAQLEEYRQQAQRLQSLVGLKDTYALEGVTAHVLSRSSDAWNQVVTLDKGSNDGISNGLFAVGNSGLVGQVITTTAYTCNVRLLADPQSGVAVMVQSTRQGGVLKGSLDGLLYLEGIDDDAVVNAGDVIITSGLGGSYHAGIIVGTVVKVEGSQGSTSRKIVVEPNGSTGPLEEVMVVTAMNPDGAAAQQAATSATTSSTTGSSGSGDSGSGIVSTSSNSSYYSSTDNY